MLTIIIGQVLRRYGVPKTAGDSPTWVIIGQLGDIDGPTVLTGGLSLALVLSLRRWLQLISGSLVVVLLVMSAER